MRQFLLYLDELCDDSLGYAAAALCSELMSHEVPQCSDSTGCNGDLKKEEESVLNVSGYLVHVASMYD